MPSVTPAAVRKQLAAGKPESVYLIVGDDDTEMSRLAGEFSALVETLTGNRGIAQTRIGFVATRTGRKEIYLADADGANVTQLTRDNNISVAPCLSPDGRSLVYTGYKSGYADVYEVSLGSGTPQHAPMRPFV